MPQFNNFNHNQSQNQNSNMSMNQGNNQNSNVNYGHNQAQNNGTYGDMSQRQNQSRLQNQNQPQSQNQNQYGNQGQSQAGQHGRNQRNPFGFNRYGNSYSNYTNNPNNEMNQRNNEESVINNEPQTISEAETINNESIYNETRQRGNSRNRTNYQSYMNHEINNKNVNSENNVYSKQNGNITQTIENTKNLNMDNPKLDNEDLKSNNITSINSGNSNENNQSSDENNNHTKRMNYNNSELNTASIKNSFDINDGGTPVIKLGGQYGFNLEKKMNVETGIGKQSNESPNVYEEDLLKINSLAVAERKHSYKKLYCSDKPYPNIEVSGENLDYAIYLLNDYASSLSELTAITSYCFLNLVLEDEYQEIKDTYRGISIVEMHHLHMLGEMIKKLGVLPRYYAKEANEITMWNSNFVSGDTDMKTTLLNSIENEEAGIVQYQKQIELIEDENIKVVLARIILDEEVHVSLLQDLYKRYCPE